jgi:hypothetical protein
MADHALTSLQLRSKFSRRGLWFASGKVQCACATAHLANRAVGLMSLAADEAARL